MSARAVAFLIGLLFVGLGAWMLLRPRDEVRVTLTNETARPIAWVALDHERGGERVDHLTARATKTLAFRPGGETSFRLRVRFDDGAEYAREGGYAEPGYSVRIALRDTAIVVTTHALR